MKWLFPFLNYVTAGDKQTRALSYSTKQPHSNFQFLYMSIWAFNSQINDHIIASEHNFVCKFADDPSPCKVAACGLLIMTACHSERHCAALSQTDDISVTATCNNDVMTHVQVHASAEQVDCTGY